MEKNYEDLISKLNSVLGTKFEMRLQRATAVQNLIFQEAPEKQRARLVEYFIKNFGTGSIKPTEEILEIPIMSKEKFNTLTHGSKINALIERMSNWVAFDKLEADEFARKLAEILNCWTDADERTIIIFSLMVTYTFTPYRFVKAPLTITGADFIKVLEEHVDEVENIQSALITEKAKEKSIKFRNTFDAAGHVMALIESHEDPKVRLTLLIKALEASAMEMVIRIEEEGEVPIAKVDRTTMIYGKEGNA